MSVPLAWFCCCFCPLVWSGPVHQSGLCLSTSLVHWSGLACQSFLVCQSVLVHQSGLGWSTSLVWSGPTVHFSLCHVRSHYVYYACIGLAIQNKISILKNEIGIGLVIRNKISILKNEICHLLCIHPLLDTLLCQPLLLV